MTIKSRISYFFIVLIINFSLIFLIKLDIDFSSVFFFNVFLFSISLIGELLKKYFIKLKKLATTYLLIINFLRIFLCFLFLLPIISNYQKSDNTYIYNFFICYFLYLFYDIIMQSKNHIKLSNNFLIYCFQP